MPIDIIFQNESSFKTIFENEQFVKINFNWGKFHTREILK